METTGSGSDAKDREEEIADLCREFQRGSAEALDALYRAFDRPLHRWLLFLTNDLNRAADLVRRSGCG